MLISFKVEKLVVSAIPDLVETWTEGFGFTPVSNDEKRSLNKINLMVFPGTILLKKPLYMTTKSDTPPGKWYAIFHKFLKKKSVVGIELNGTSPLICNHL